jgi:hypothetical protein
MSQGARNVRDELPAAEPADDPPAVAVTALTHRLDDPRPAEQHAFRPGQGDYADRNTMSPTSRVSRSSSASVVM